MSFLNKLQLFKKFSHHAETNKERHKNSEFEVNDGNSLHFHTDQIRILLFRECEQRGRKLLFDSLPATDTRNCDSMAVNNVPVNNRENRRKRESVNTISESAPEYDKCTSDDVSLLSEMIFGTVAMAYKGPSFKIHSIDSPPCVMFSKVFSDSEHIERRQREKRSDETVGYSNSSSGSMKTQNFRPSSGNLSGNSLSPNVRTNSTYSSASSGLGIRVLPPLDSSQSLNNSSSSSIGSSLSSLRRKWLKVKSTSFSQSDSYVMFGHYGDSTIMNKESRRYKTRLGLAMLIRLSTGCEKKMQTKILEHAALLEGIFDRLLNCCIESSKRRNGLSRTDLVDRLEKATSRCTIWLLHLFLDENESAYYPLLWHEIFMSSILSQKPRIDTLYRSLEQMCHLLDELDTKSTNFFVSTLVTAILTHHLGWIHTVIPDSNHQLLEEWEKLYPYNPLWAQLGDLYGALSNPTKIGQTVIAGSPDKKNMINSILTFASYFLRSSIVKKMPAQPYFPEQDINKSVVLLSNTAENHSSLLQSACVENLHKSSDQNDNNIDRNKVFPKMKGNKTLRKDLHEYNSSLQENNYDLDLKVVHKQNINNAQFYLLNEVENDCPPSNVKIIVSKSENDMTRIISAGRSSSLGNLEVLRTGEPNEAFNNNESTLFHDSLYTNRPCHSSDNLLNTESSQSVHFMLGDDEGPPNLRCVKKQITYINESSLKTTVNTFRHTVRKKCDNNLLVLSTNSITDSKRCLNVPANESKNWTNYDNSMNNEDSTNSQTSLEYLLQENSVVELPMPQILKVESLDELKRHDDVGFLKTLLKKKVTDSRNTRVDVCSNNYIWGMVMQGVIKKKHQDRSKKELIKKETTVDKRKEWWWRVRDEIAIAAKCPVLDQPVDETFCILADLDTWQVGLLSNKLPASDLLVPVGMSRLVSNMLEAFLYIWKKYHSPEHCTKLLESRLREMWFKSEVLTQILMVVNFGDVTIANLTNALDVDAADLPLLLAVATMHTPQVAERVGLSFS